MIWKISILPKAETDLSWFRRHNKSYYTKCFDLIRDILQNPRQGIGKPEPLKHALSGYWSRRITDEHRVVYKVENDSVFIAQLRYHY